MKRVLFHLKNSFLSQNIQFFVFFPFLSTLSRYKRTDGSGIVYDVMNWLHKFADVIFEITQQLLYITSSNLAR